MVTLAMINKMADLDITDMNINDQIKKTIHIIGDGLHWFSEKYREFKDDVLDIPLILSGEIDREFNEFMIEVAKNIKKIKAFNELLNFYMDYQSWFEEFHFTERLEDVVGDLKL